MTAWRGKARDLLILYPIGDVAAAINLDLGDVTAKNHVACKGVVMVLRHLVEHAFPIVLRLWA